MELNDESQVVINELSSEILETMETIVEGARKQVLNSVNPGSEVLAATNSYTTPAPLQALKAASKDAQDSYRTLMNEPVIARVVTEDDDGNRKTHYICRTTALQGISNLAGYKTQWGRLASLPVGDEFQREDGSYLTIIEQAHVKPKVLADGLDSVDTIIQSEDLGPVTIKSLRAQLSRIAGDASAEDILAQLLAEETDYDNIINGIRRSVIDKMGLRDQAVLDKYQDEIFRLPLNKRLIILGPAGTGKTTTLIKRLGQKLDTVYLDSEEQRLVETVAGDQVLPHASSWLMFTPTELLKQYLKEAFAREGVPAPDQRIRTWHDYRRELGRNALGVLRSSTGSGAFVLKDGALCLNEEAVDNPIEWYDNFNAWQQNAYLQELQEAAHKLRQAPNPEASNIGVSLEDIFAQSEDVSIVSLFSALAVEITKVQALLSSFKESSDAKIHSALNWQLNRNRSFIDELARVLGSLQQAAVTDVEDQDEADTDEDEDTAPRTPRAAAVSAYKQAVRAQARAAASKRSVGKTTRNGKILEWLGDRGLSDADQMVVGESLLVQASARRFVNPVKRYLDGIPKRYRAFRREEQAQCWYQPEYVNPREITPLELDIVLLAILRGAGEFLSRPGVLRDIDRPGWSSLKPFLGYYRNQILVDEATDFSPIQLACMAQLAHPRLRSFFACGDFNQRLTTWGARSASDLKWVFADLDTREVTVSYRQSKQLNDLARAIIRAVGGSEQSVSLPAHVDNTGVAPVLLEQADSTAITVAWLADRIREVEQLTHPLPSTAIFVNSEEEVGPLAEALNAALAEDNIPVVACHEGQAVGQESNVRVFDIQHIKGLEFEAVFFVAIDQLANQNPALFDKYLYVGATRAATYLGLTCQNTLPTSIESLRAHFSVHW